jgi:glutathione peroxidase-family protein
MTKRRTTIYIEEVVWNRFMKYLVERYGKTHGGVISEEIEKAILLLIKK